METIVAAAISAPAVIAAAWINARGRSAAAPASPSPLPQRRPTRACDGSRRPRLAALVAFVPGGLGVAISFRTKLDTAVGAFLLVPLGLSDSAVEDEPIAWWSWVLAALGGLDGVLLSESASRRLDARAPEPALAPQRGRYASPVAGPTIDDIDSLVGPATPHFAMQIRARVEELVGDLPADDPVRRHGEERMALLERLALASSKAEEGARESRDRLGWSELPSAAPAYDPLPPRS